ncbi:MAG: phytanoyl-CoA dioxygenase [Litoreibacter sp.]|nr:phytanoyl-CoA dioxygenase [Litoreibacter sp.]
MNRMSNPTRGYYAEDACDIGEFAALVLQDIDPSDVPHAAETPNNVPVYDIPALSAHLEEAAQRRILMTEWANVLRKGAGVFVLGHAYTDTSAIDAATAIFDQIIAREKTANGGGADHFAAAGSNDRIWNSLQKLCEADPETFLRYHANPAVDAACEAWLGPHYQMTAQVNLVHPGGAAQQAHRDYHLGFQTAEVSAQFPAHVHDLSPLMTLQGGIAHGDTPLEGGPTKLLPFSQLYRPGYAAWRREDFRAFFEDHHVQVPLQKGDALFFNPALFHAAGANCSADIHRMVNLLQVSSAFGRAMETVNRLKMCKLVFDPLKQLVSTGELGGAELDATIAATAEGYSFPTNLDSDPPANGLAPQTQAALLKESVLDSISAEAFHHALDAQEARKQA